jgi:ubiquitin carboxyl-terminal hydrolase 36/42
MRVIVGFWCLQRFEGIFGAKIDKAIAFEEVLVLSSFMSKTSQVLMI